jgi:hypothetical protein
MGLGVDLGVGCRDRMKVEPTSGDVTMCELSAAVVWWGSGCCMIEGQSAPTAEGYLPDQSIVTEAPLK